MSPNQFFLLVQESAIFQNKLFCTFGQNVATLKCLVRSSYPQLHGFVNLIPILQGGLEIVLLSWRTFPLTDLHSAEHLCSRSCIVFKAMCQENYSNLFSYKSRLKQIIPNLSIQIFNMIEGQMNYICFLRTRQVYLFIYMLFKSLLRRLCRLKCRIPTIQQNHLNF